MRSGPNALVKLLSASGIARLARALLVGRGRFVLEFHGIVSRHYPDLPAAIGWAMTANELRHVLVWLKDRFSFISPNEFFNSDAAGVLLTFDDGLASNYASALAVLEELEIPAIFFVATQHVIDPADWLAANRRRAGAGWGSEETVPQEVAADFFDGMSAEQLARCADSPLVTIGAHTVSHPHLTRCSRSEVEYELSASRRFLTEITDQSIDLFAYPYGDYNRDVARAVRACGYRAAFAEDSLGVGMPEYEIPRVGIYQAEHAYLDLKLSGLHRLPIRAGRQSPYSSFEHE